MKRRFSTRDVGLSVRMVVALVVVCGIYAAFEAMARGLGRPVS